MASRGRGFPFSFEIEVRFDNFLAFPKTLTAMKAGLNVVMLNISFPVELAGDVAQLKN